jgi:hypothetical protein
MKDEYVPKGWKQRLCFVHPMALNLTSICRHEVREGTDDSVPEGWRFLKCEVCGKPIYREKELSATHEKS